MLLSRFTGRLRSGSRSFSLRVVILALVASVVAASVTSTANAATGARSKFPASISSAVKLANLAGFAHIRPGQLKKSAPVTAALLTPDMAIQLTAYRGSALVDQPAGVAITGAAADGSVVVLKANRSGLGFGIVTNRHSLLTYRYKAILAPGTRITAAPDGGLDQVNAAGVVVDHISPAYAIDSTGTKMRASYRFDSLTDELMVEADSTYAKGAVFIDPSWHCVAIASFYGAVWVLAAAAWLFSDGVGAAFLAWALRAWFGLSLNAANSIARACT